jgi:predicted ATP-grasp superfamily ATP-dependent carboligase
VVATLRVLLPEGSSLSAREAATALGEVGCSVDVLDPDPLCICRFSRHVGSVYRSPRLSDSPQEFAEFLLAHIGAHHYDVVLPVHEHAFLLSTIRADIQLHSAVAISPCEAFERLQSKVHFFKFASELRLPHAPTLVVESIDDFPLDKPPPYYVKTAFGTAGDGTWRVESREARDGVLADLRARSSRGDLGAFLVQDVVPGKLEVIQSVFRNGELVASHAYRQRIEGVGGSASGRMGVRRPRVKEELTRIGRALCWHGALMLDYIFDDASGDHWFIDPNPRIGETMNAFYSGLNLPWVMVCVSRGEAPDQQRSREGVCSHILLSAILGLALKTPKRLKIFRELVNAVCGVRHYARSREEVSRVSTDPISLVPTITVAMGLLLNPHAAGTISRRAIHNYSLTEKAANSIRMPSVGDA